MEQERKSRVAVGVFYEQEKLHEAISRLKDAVNLNGVIAALGKPHVIQVAFPDYEKLEANELAACAVVRDGTDDSKSFPLQQVTSFDNWISPKSASTIKQHIAEEAFVVFTFFSSAMEELNIYRILMKLACEQIELHDLPSIT